MWMLRYVSLFLFCIVALMSWGDECGDSTRHKISRVRKIVRNFSSIDWRWVFLGYTVDLVHLGASDKKQDFNLSLYSNQIGVDLFYRKSGNDYHIAGIDLGKKFDTSAMKNVDFKDLSSSIKGFNLYYIFNQ